MTGPAQFDLFASAPSGGVTAPGSAGVSESADAPALLPDAAARLRIETDLDANLLVEAGAGAGKTTAMVGRMVALVRSGRAEVPQLAAVTFTRKAAAELREKFQTALERALQEAQDAELRARLDRALRDIDRAFLGTIHAFSARLLRERPLEAGLDPGFRETLGSEEARLQREFWFTHLERLAADGDATVAELAGLGLKPQQLRKLFEQLVAQPDVRFEAENRGRPDAGPVRRRIEQLMDEAASFLPHVEPAKGWDPLQVSLRRLRFHRFVLGWARDTQFLDAIAELHESSFKATQNRWPDGRAAKQLQEEFQELFAAGGAADRLRRAWWAFRYPRALAFANRAAVAYETERLRAGTLNFQDLLMFAARLLRQSAAARRELGERYRFLLVDEFQDTDPVQAEVLFLLASEPETGTRWRSCTPRAGALFVVGDPKQSIYRFRRADMTLYAQVRSRFEEFGAVLELIANFRSGKPIEEFVNQNFERRFPVLATDEQAGFAPMHVQPRAPVPGRTEGVFWYELDDPVNSTVERLARQDSERLATWIRQRLDAGERRPGDFLVLIPKKARLAEYATALERRNIPVQVTGAGVGEDKYLRELRLLLRALADPGDPSLCVAVLVGIFFGIDYERLTRHAEKWAPQGQERRRDPFSFTGSWPEETEVERALAELHRFWSWTRADPADLALERIVAEVGLIPLAAAGELGQTRAGALLFALDAVRATALAGDASLNAALAALETALEEDESEAPLEPGRTDVVRLMNLHKAKGLEAPVVVLAHPFGGWKFEPESRVVRDAAGDARGFMPVTERRSARGAPAVLAQPLDWEEHAALERRFLHAEGERLLYVAATRAGDELVVGMAANPNSRSPWAPFHNWLQERGLPLALPVPGEAERRVLERTAAEVMAAVTAAAQRRAAAGVATYRVASVTARKGLGETETAPPLPEAELIEAGGELVQARHERGTEWGSIVHEALEAAMRGETDARLSALGRGWLVAAERPLDAEGEPVELPELLALVRSVRAARVWQQALASPLRLTEVPFAIALTAAEYATMIGRAEPAPDAAPQELIDGRIDLAFRDPEGWTIVDYKSDAEGAAIPPELMRRYATQVRLYGRIWERLTGERVQEQLLLFTAGGLVSVPAA